MEAECPHALSFPSNPASQSSQDPNTPGSSHRAKPSIRRSHNPSCTPECRQKGPDTAANRGDLLQLTERGQGRPHEAILLAVLFQCQYQTVRASQSVTQIGVQGQGDRQLQLYLKSLPSCAWHRHNAS